MTIVTPTPSAAPVELKTADGAFTIAERRSRPRPVKPRAVTNAYGSSAQMSALGGLIIIGVLIASYTTKYDLALGHAQGPLAVPAVGYLALQLFLARAAYRLYHDVRQIKDLGAFIEHRILRFLPPVIPAVLLGFVIVRCADIPCFHAKASSLPANLMMVADFFGVPEIDGSHWRFKIELSLSALIGMAWFGPLRHYLAGLLLVGLGVTALYIDGEPARHNVATWHGLLSADGYLPLLAFGIALHRLAEDRTMRIWQGVAAASLLLAFLSNTVLHGAIVVAALGILTAIVMGHLKFLGNVRSLVRLGNLAFPIYVVHFVSGFAVIRGLEQHGVPPVIAIMAASGLAIALGWLLHVVFEKPALVYGPGVIRVLARAVLALIPDRVRAFGSAAMAYDPRGTLKQTA